MSQRRRASAADTIAPASPTGGRQSSLIEDYDGKIPIVNRMSRDTTTLDEGFASLGNLNDDSREDARVTPGSFCKHRRPVSSSSFTTTSSSENENIIGDTRLAGVSGEAERSLMEDKEGSCKAQEGEGSPGASELLGKGNNISVPLATPGLSVKADYRCSPKRLPRASFDEAAQVVMKNGTKSGLVTQVTVDSINLNEVYSYAPNERKGSDVSEFSLVDIGSERSSSVDSAIDMTLRSRASVARASIYEPILESADLEERAAEPNVGTEEGGDLQVRPPTLDFPQHPPETCQTELRISAVNLHRPHPFVRFVRYILRLLSICIPRSLARSVPVPLTNYAFSGSEEDETHPSAAEDRKSSDAQNSCFPPPTLEPTWRSHPTHNPQPSPPPPPVSPPSTPRASASCPPDIPLKDFLLSFDRTRSKAEDAGLNVIGRMVQIANFAAAMLDSRGGFLSIDALDVHLYVPPGAIPFAELPQRVYIYVQGGLTSGRNYVTPYVHCGPSGYHFKKDVALTLPHCAKGDQEFTFEKTSSARSTVLQDPDVAVLIQSESVTLTMDHFCGIGAHGSCKSLLVCAFIKHIGKDLYIHIRVFNNTKVNFKEVEKEEQDQGFVLGPSRQELLEPQRENPVVITFQLSTEKWEITHPESTLVAEQRIQPEYLWRQCSSDSVETFPSKSFSARCPSLSGSDTFSGVLRVFQEGKEDAAVVLTIESPGKVGTFKKHPTSNELDALMFDELKRYDRICVAGLMDPCIFNKLCDKLDKPLDGGTNWHHLPEYLMEDGDHGHGWVASIEAKARSQGRSPTELVLITFFTASRGKGKQQTLRDLNSGLSKLCEARQDIQFAVDATERKLRECEDESKLTNKKRQSKDSKYYSSASVPEEFFKTVQIVEGPLV
ncbi:uncharacterized protein LOC110987158 [Acanthaster planci]|uniref:Netrin receptor UNC5 n=1 Tax=Acanthaster planci TaxID=133434 RepID=A0A8B7ZIE2_ACAPL|nr:uncharacterized protein LOC110987158 [Acanthaster planci]